MAVVRTPADCDNESHSKPVEQRLGTGEVQPGSKVGLEREVEAERQGGRVKGDGQHCTPRMCDAHALQSGTTPRSGGHRQKSPSDGDFDGTLGGCVRGDPGTRPHRCNLRINPREYVGAFQYQDRRRENPSLEWGRGEAGHLRSGGHGRSGCRSGSESLERVRSTSQPARGEDFWCSVWPPRVRCCPAGEDVSEAGNAHSKDPSRARSTICRSCCIAPVPGQITCSEWLTLIRCTSSHRLTMRRTQPLCLQSFGGLGLRSASRTRMAGFWASWADCLPMIEARHPEVAAQVIAQLEGHPNGHSLRAAADAAHRLAGRARFRSSQLEGIGRLLATKKSTSQGGSTKRPRGLNRNIGKPCS